MTNIDIFFGKLKNSAFLMKLMGYDIYTKSGNKYIEGMKVK
jgi:hypothetical protein